MAQNLDFLRDEKLEILQKIDSFKAVKNNLYFKDHSRSGRPEYLRSSKIAGRAEYFFTKTVNKDGMHFNDAVEMFEESFNRMIDGFIEVQENLLKEKK